MSGTQTQIESSGEPILRVRCDEVYKAASQTRTGVIY